MRNIKFRAWDNLEKRMRKSCVATLARRQTYISKT